jgi:hypothetical protein
MVRQSQPVRRSRFVSALHEAIRAHDNVLVTLDGSILIHTVASDSCKENIAISIRVEC